MDSDWVTHFEGTIEGRDVKIESHSDDGYRVSTTQLGDYSGIVYGDESSTLIIPPSAHGFPVELEAASLDELREELAKIGFGWEAIDEILSHISA